MLNANINRKEEETPTILQKCGVPPLQVQMQARLCSTLAHAISIQMIDAMLYAH